MPRAAVQWWGVLAAVIQHVLGLLITVQFCWPQPRVRTLPQSLSGKVVSLH